MADLKYAHQMFDGMPLQMIRREELRITYWNYNTASLNMNPFKEAHGPVFAAFTSLSIAEYKGENVGTSTNHTCVFIAPPIEEELMYMHEFSKVGDKIRVTILADAEVVDTIKTVSELYTLEEDMYKYRTIKCTAWLDHISMARSWYYIACSQRG